MRRTTELSVRSRANGRCEYCHLPEPLSKLAFSIDHVIARQHGGRSTMNNLSLCCGFCNRHKGPNIAGLDPDTGNLTRLFHPRGDRWNEHFHWEGARLIGLTPIGRTTIAVLAINHDIQIAIRQALLDEGMV